MYSCPVELALLPLQLLVDGILHCSVIGIMVSYYQSFIEVGQICVLCWTKFCGESSSILDLCVAEQST
jgi:hypothetical protein